MNRKGFTLIELLAVIVILGIILTIAVPNLSSVYKDSKLKNEEIFLNRLSDSISSYISLNTDTITFTDKGTVTKQNETEEVNIYEGIFTVEDVIDDNLLSEDKYKNSGNKEVSCNTNATIYAYRDSDFVYCYRVEKGALGCLSDDYLSTLGTYAIDTCNWVEQ